ncbi:MAG: HD-GYP domain-containing protein [Oscillospiraceae bacterium]|nr:HD-GYP domain-containing protein [Oscillospiraceae bacterium]
MKKTDIAAKTVLSIFLLGAVILFICAMFTEGDLCELHTGGYELYELSEGWDLRAEDGTVHKGISLPYIDDIHGSTVALTNTLPDTIRDGMHLCFRSRRQEVSIYIDGKLRAEHTAANSTVKFRSPVSALVVCDLYNSDASKEICIYVTSHESDMVRYESVVWSYGSDLWYPYIYSSIPIVAIAAMSVILSFLAITGCLVLRSRISSIKSVLYLSMTMISIGLWILSESSIKQLLFKSPSMSNLFSYILIEVAAAFGAMYFNEVQQHRYTKVYVTLECMAAFIVTMNTALHFSGLADYSDTLPLSHILSAVIILWSAISMIMDTRSGAIRGYSITAVGMLLLTVMSILELMNFYIKSPMAMGLYLSIGLLMLLFATMLQIIADTIRNANARRLWSENMTRMTFGTIAGTIDAKDKYTGGHSERVGEYASRILAKVLKGKGHQADIERIKYIGQMHDIGKIGVPDSILNKNGRLTEEEFDVMKSHTVIGSRMIGKIDFVEGLGDGVRHHHERYDGKGYPDGLKGDEISLFAKVLCLADCYDAMTTDRVYRKKLSKERVIEEIENNKGTQFDPELADIVLDMIRNGEL